jgi:Domain of unknown function (DUF4389)
MAEAGVPAKVIVRDDLARSRVTVFFRLLLAIPHLIWISLWTIAAVLAAIANWFATLAIGRPPSALYRFLSAYVRYAVHLSSYVLLAANPFPGFTGEAGSYPIDVEIAPRDRQHRLKTLFRIILVIPAGLVSAVAAGGGGGGGGGSSGSGHGGRVWTSFVGSGVWVGALTFVVAFLAWFAVLARGRMPQGFRNTIAWAVGYSAQVHAYLLLLSDRYPNSDPGATGVLGAQPPHPISLRIEDDLRRSRVTVFFRLLLAIPHFVWLYLWGVAVEIAIVINWFATLILGRTPRWLHRFLSAYVRYQTHVWAFVTLVANPFPGFVGRPGIYPIDVEIEGPARQHRLKTLFRAFLAVPAVFVSWPLLFLLFVVSFLGWFAALFTGRMPTGFRNVGAWVLRYTAQTNAYLYLITDRYPYSGPEAGEAAPEPVEETSPLEGDTAEAAPQLA